MTFLTILGVTEICIFKLVVEVKIGKEKCGFSSLQFLETFSTNNSAEDNNSGPLNSGGIADLPLFRTLSNSSKVPRASLWEVMGSCFISICKFGSFRNPFATIISLFGC